MFLEVLVNAKLSFGFWSFVKITFLLALHSALHIVHNSQQWIINKQQRTQLKVAQGQIVYIRKSPPPVISFPQIDTRLNDSVSRVSKMKETRIFNGNKWP